MGLRVFRDLKVRNIKSADVVFNTAFKLITNSANDWQR
jgi:hypothetical protein